MKNKFSIIILLAIITIFLTGCSKYEKDKSYDTDLYGSYLENIEASNISYTRNESYTFNTDNSYNHTYKEVMDGNVNSDIDENGKILSTEEMSNDITQIVLDQEITDGSTGETSNLVMYKYKNMIGHSNSFIKTEIPNGKTFDLIIPTPSENWTGSYPNAANVFDKNGFYHSCLDITNCNDTEDNHVGLYYKYVCKNNIIYFIDPSVEGMNWQILYYIVEDGLFAPELYKVEEQ